jgi:flagellar biosynthesis/type III secretory pathway M-ring protein FliF/YscJ
MVVIDDDRNGWRHLLLPIAQQQQVVMQAVIAASAFHFSAKHGRQLVDANTAYATTIRQLREQQDLSLHDMLGKQTILLSLLVLLIVVMINGSSDFPIIMRLLESAIEAIGGEELLTHHELGLFIVRQIRK